VDLEYGDVDAIEGIPSVAEVLNADDAEIIEDEIDTCDDGTFEHRFLFAPEGEVRIRFRRFGFSATPVGTRDFERTEVTFDD